MSVNRDWQARALNGSLPRELLVRLLSDSYKHAGPSDRKQPAGQPNRITSKCIYVYIYNGPYGECNGRMSMSIVENM